MDKLNLTDAEWRERLSPEQYHVLREGGTERAFTGKYNSNKADGVYYCAGCGAELFDAEEKYDSGSGWPSFTAPVDIDAVDEIRDTSHGLIRTRSEEHTSELQSLMRISYAVFCLKKKQKKTRTTKIQ